MTTQNQEDQPLLQRILGSPQSSENWIQDYLDFNKKRGRIQLHAELAGSTHLNNILGEMEKNSEAEAAYVRKHVWDQQPSQGADDDMGDTILGDVTVNHITPTSQQQPQQQQQTSSLMKTLGTVALGALLPTAGAGALAGYLLAKPSTQQ